MPPEQRATARSAWAQWRGPLGTGVAPLADPPLTWSESENLHWKIEIPGHGHSTPIVWGNRIFLTTAVAFGDDVEPVASHDAGAHDNATISQRHRFIVLSVDRDDGEILWQRTLNEELPHEGGHRSGSLASASPVTDGEHVFAFFGSRGLYALDLDGKIVWQADLGEMRTKHEHGEGSSPALYKNTLVVNWDHEGESFVVAFDKRDGKERWRVARDEVTSWSTPIIVEQDGRAQAIVNGTGRVRGYDLATGRVLWECGGLSHNIVASPVAADGMVYVASSYEKQAMLAIRLAGAAGDLTGTDHIVWSRTRSTPYVPSPLLYDDALYFLNHYQGVLSRVEAESGEEAQGPFRLVALRNIYASPVAAAGRIYITDRSGMTLVLSHAASPAVLARNRLDDSFSASAALVDRDLFLRGSRYLYRLGEPATDTSARGEPNEIPGHRFR